MHTMRGVVTIFGVGAHWGPGAPLADKEGLVTCSHFSHERTLTRACHELAVRNEDYATHLCRPPNSSTVTLCTSPSFTLSFISRPSWPPCCSHVLSFLILLHYVAFCGCMHVYVCGQICATATVWRSEDNSQASVLSFLHGGTRDPTSVSKCDSKPYHWPHRTYFLWHI